MDVLVLGAGIIGLTTAYFLNKEGFEVTVVDRNNDVALETSFANGAQLSYSYVAPLAGPGVMSHVPKWLLDKNSPLRFRPSLDPATLCWNVRFMKACTATQSNHTTRELLTLSFLSRDLYHTMMQQENIAFDHKRAGKLIVHRSRDSFDHAVEQLDFQRSLGCEQRALSVEECLSLEPSLQRMRDHLSGGIYTESEESGDCYQLAVALKKILQQRGVTFRFNTPIKKLVTDSTRKVSVQTDNAERLSADHIVVALGCDSTALLKPLGIAVPVSPLKGYSLTLPIQSATDAPVVSITDYERKVVYARLGERLRVAGMADMVGLDRHIDTARIETLKQEARNLFPDAGNYDLATLWAGLRPATPKGKPIIDGTRYGNLWLNIGQGALGFTLASGSARVMTDLIRGQPLPLERNVFTLADA
ncbi:D-amino acid dehydrogenase [Advenella kashmirensis W13003]|uniref:D-amino acid dehydrogenase n=1 Tax=Advenella kashmirensis W13003 TaxID=1424334 RepID=V8QMT2_9BURK|nr:D-amino acid dehydrogenase [Advenella kashmirensis]ETF00309.1 D-amino acid dehydrogenase [Advenella kashmirensis W13003]